MDDVVHQKDQLIKKDFLISYTEFQRQWATWIACSELLGHSSINIRWIVIVMSSQLCRKMP
jgi:hypothetical protein